MSAAEWARNRGEPSPLEPTESPPAEPKKPEEKKEDLKLSGQIVATAPGNNEVPEDSAYLAESNNRVQKETRARVQDVEYKNAAPRRSATKASDGVEGASAQVAQLAGNDGVGTEDAPFRPGSGAVARSFQVPAVQSRDQIAMRVPREGSGPGVNVANQASSEAMPGNSARLKIHPGQEGRGDGQQGSLGRAGRRGITALMPSAAAMDAIVGSAAPDDLRNVDEGDATALNTREWKYASFFNRIGKLVLPHWSRGVDREVLVRDRTGQIYLRQDRATSVKVVLDDSGELQSVTVVKSSGVEFLDQAVVDAFKQVAWFGPPPGALLSSERTVAIPMSFTVEAGTGVVVRSQGMAPIRSMGDWMQRMGGD
ncbi:MAG: energy transducer TonB [Myxococcaceae bacterium]|nr:energy transducer TonB [Myxococcaceae bacterium]MCI0670650.1 energy transducer TonB [Myxococcaceae bacterium]